MDFSEKDEFLRTTDLLDFENPKILQLIQSRDWRNAVLKNKILSIYNFVRDEIKFGYNIDDAIPASKILEDGYGQCNTKGILFMALLRAVGVPCRFHGFTIDKKLQKGAIKGIWYILAPASILHSWVEIYYKKKWLNIEGFILDAAYLTKLQQKFPECKTDFCGYGVATKNFRDPKIYWNEGDTFIQKEGINQDFGIFDSPDVFFIGHRQKLSFLKKLLYQNFVRKLMNKNVDRIRRA